MVRKIKDKLISFPEEVLDVLDVYKKKTGIPATDYIRRAVVKQMIVEGLIFIQTRYIIVEQKRDNVKVIDDSDAVNSNSFCDGDGDKCELPALAGKC